MDILTNIASAMLRRVLPVLTLLFMSAATTEARVGEGTLYLIRLSDHYAITSQGLGIYEAHDRFAIEDMEELARVRRFAAHGPWVFGEGWPFGESCEPNAVKWFLFDTRTETAQAKAAFRAFADEREWQSALRQIGIAKWELIEPHSVAQTRPAFEAWPLNYRLMHRLLWLSDDEWSLVFVAVLFVLCIVFAFVGEPRHTPQTILPLVLGSAGTGVFLTLCGGYECCAGFVYPGLAFLVYLGITRLRRGQ